MLTVYFLGSCLVGSEESSGQNGPLLGVACDHQPAGSPGLQAPPHPPLSLSSSPPVPINQFISIGFAA